MTTLKSFIKSKPVLSYYVLTFAITWGGILLVIGGPGGVPGTPEQFETMLPFMILAMLAGPSVAGILLTGLVHGGAGLREFLSRLLKWRVDARWYAVALLTAPLLMTVIPLALSLLFPEFLPGIITKNDKASLLQLSIMAGLGAGIFEEIGWTGFAIPMLRKRYGILATGLIVGFLWGAWHVLVNFWSSGSPSGAISLPLLLHSLFFSVGILPAFRILMVWVYDRTASLLVAMLMHFSLTAGNVLLVPLASGAPLVTWSIVIAAAMWVVVAALVLTNRGQFLRQPLPVQTA
ncbi:CPBP family intramembrane metalloprotease [candidate division KSB1 bacterium]|nr:CPBP family intramembrane metalloprotease [candidate division KSB1 bacterium]